MKDMIRQERFYLLGMGARKKLIFKNHCLFSLEEQRVIACFDEHLPVCIEPSEYRVRIGEDMIWENEMGIYMRQDGVETVLAESPVHLPDFAQYRHSAWMRALHADILVSLVDGKPVPNPIVYRKPWYRDSAMMCMVLEHTGNLDLVKDWILSLDELYDRNNKGNEEPDNLGQALYMISLVSDASHPLVNRIIKEAKRRTENGHLTGLSDYAPHPVYQTKWLKYGLKRLGLEDDWQVPDVEDSYTDLFWMDEVAGFREEDPKPYDCLYPYLSVARAHYRREPLTEQPPQPEEYPISWEIQASEAEYDRNHAFLPHYERTRTGAPHTWHAAELFLYLHDRCDEEN